MSAGRFLVQQSKSLPFRFPQLRLPPRQQLLLRFSGGVRCPEDSVTLFPFFSRPKAGRFCRGELRSPTGNNQPTDNNNRPTGNNRPARFLGFWGDFWVIWAHAMRPYGFWGDFWVIWAHAMRPYGFLGGWAHAMRPYGFLGLFGRTRCAPTGFWAHQKAKTPASS